MVTGPRQCGKTTLVRDLVAGARAYRSLDDETALAGVRQDATGFVRGLVLAHHSGQLMNFTQIGGQHGLDDKTTKKYVAILEQLFLVRRLEPWFNNQLKRLVKTPKLLGCGASESGEGLPGSVRSSARCSRCSRFQRF